MKETGREGKVEQGRGRRKIMNKRIIKPANVCDGVAGCARMLPGHAAGCTATRIHRGYCGGCGDSLHSRGSPGEGGDGRRQGGEASPRLAAWLTFNDFSNFEPSTAGVCAGGVCGRCVASMCGRCVCVCGCVFVCALVVLWTFSNKCECECNSC